MKGAAGTPAIDHLGWAVRSIDSSRFNFESKLGLDLQSDERFLDVRVAFFGAGSTQIELLEPLNPESDVGRGLALLLWAVTALGGRARRYRRRACDAILVMR